MKSVTNSVRENTQFLDLYTHEKTKFGSAAAILNLGMLFQIQEIVSVKINKCNIISPGWRLLCSAMDMSYISPANPS